MLAGLRPGRPGGRASCRSTSTATRPAARRGFDAIARVVHRAGVGCLHQRLPECRPPAASSCRPTRDRMQPKTCSSLNVTNGSGRAVPFSAFASTRWVTGADGRCATTAIRRCGISATRPRPHRRRHGRDGTSPQQLPASFGFEWTGQSRAEKLSRLAGPPSCWRSRCWPCSALPGRPVRAGRSRGRDAGSVGHPDRCWGRWCATCPTTRLLQGGPDHGDGAVRPRTPSRSSSSRKSSMSRACGLDFEATLAGLSPAFPSDHP